MSVKLLVLKSGEDLIADVQEMVVNEKVVGYFLTRPCGVSLNSKAIKIDDENESFELKLFPWCPLTKQDKIPIAADWVVTIVDPIDKINISIFSFNNSDSPVAN